jgi:hypothetical protein
MTRGINACAWGWVPVHLAHCNRQGEEECAAFANLAAQQADAPAVHLNQRAADRKTQAGAAGFAGGRVVHLREGQEQLALILLRDTWAGIGSR